MITAIELKERMHAQPFKPFRLCLTDGKTYDIQNHDMAWVIRGTVYVGLNLDANDLAERAAQCAILHITRLEDLGPAEPSKPLKRKRANH
jgi:hypothetical protein